MWAFVARLSRSFGEGDNGLLRLAVTYLSFTREFYDDMHDKASCLKWY